MRVALVSPYSWSYQGGVNRHIGALAQQLEREGDEVRIFAPLDPPGRVTELTHRSPPVPVEPPDNLVPLGRTIGIGANGAVSNLSFSPGAVAKLRRELRDGRFDVIHVHEPVAPLIAWDAASRPGAPVVGTFHAYSDRPFPNHVASLVGARRVFNRLSRRIAVSEAAAWTGRRWFGGTYDIVPNGVELDEAPQGPTPRSGELRILFVGRPEERKGLPVLLQAFSGLVEHVPARITVAGAEPEDIERVLGNTDVAGLVEAKGRIYGPELWEEFGRADLLCAPSLEGESFGMILTEAFAASTPVIASEITGYNEVVTHGVDGLLVPPADPQRLAEELQGLYHDPDRLREMGHAARRSARRYEWPRVAGEVRDIYEQAIEAPQPEGRLERAKVRAGLEPAAGQPRVPPQRMPPPVPEVTYDTGRRWQGAKRIGLALAGVAAIALTAVAAGRIGVDRVATSIVDSDLSWVLIACGLMALSLFMRAASWYAIARAALPSASLRRRDVTSAAMIGVLMSATLPARLGEPARALVLSRRTGRIKERFAVLLGTLVSQTALNVVALMILGAIVLSSSDLFASSATRLLVIGLIPVGLLAVILLLPSLVRTHGSGAVSRVLQAVRGGLEEVRRGLTVFRNPGTGAVAASAQLGAWGVQLGACLALMHALGLNGQVGIGAAAAVLFAVNVTAVVPVTPSNIGVFQLAVISVLSTGFGVSTADALAFGIILQAVEIATSVALGVPALVREGLTWGDLRTQALSTSPVRLSPHPREGGEDSVRA